MNVWTYVCMCVYTYIYIYIYTCVASAAIRQQCEHALNVADLIADDSILVELDDALITDFDYVFSFRDFDLYFHFVWESQGSLRGLWEVYENLHKRRRPYFRGLDALLSEDDRASGCIFMRRRPHFMRDDLTQSYRGEA